MRFLRDDECPSLAMYEAAKIILGNDIKDWEGETLFIALEREGVKLSLVNHEKLMCMAALDQGQIVFSDSTAFKNFALALNHHLPHHDIEETVAVPDLAWACVALNLKGNVAAYFDYAPLEYCARTLHEEGYVVAPEGLKFCQPALSRINKNQDLEQPVFEALRDPSKKRDPLVQAQVDKLEGVSAYVKHMYDETTQRLSELRQADAAPR